MWRCSQLAGTLIGSLVCMAAASAGHSATTTIDAPMTVAGNRLRSVDDLFITKSNHLFSLESPCPVGMQWSGATARQSRRCVDIDECRTDDGSYAIAAIIDCNNKKFFTEQASVYSSTPPRFYLLYNMYPFLRQYIRLAWVAIAGCGLCLCLAFLE